MKIYLKNSVGLMLLTCVASVAFGQSSASNEKVVLTNSKPSISFCVSSGDVKVRGWERDEVRVSIDGNGVIGAKIMERDDDKKASWLMILGYEPSANDAKKQDECLRGDISLDVPRGARVGIKSKDGDLSVENVAKITIKNINGDINLRDIANETEVTSLSSDISIENANGKISAKTVSGNVEVYRCRSIEISDACKISSTSGNVSMQETAHRNIEATSTSGDVSIYGALSNGGSYDFSTTNGAISLFLPENSSFQLNATMSYGASFNSEIPLKTTAQSSNQNTQQTESRQIKATCGAGDSNINLTTFNGSLRIKKAK